MAWDLGLLGGNVLAFEQELVEGRHRFFLDSSLPPHPSLKLEIGRQRLAEKNQGCVLIHLQGLQAALIEAAFGAVGG